jgi:hypothetical protein
MNFKKIKSILVIFISGFLTAQNGLGIFENHLDIISTKVLSIIMLMTNHIP